MLDALFQFIIKGRTLPVVGKVFYSVLRFIGIDLPPNVKLGHNVRFSHFSIGLVIHPNTVIGDNVKIYQGVTLGRADIFQEDNSSAFEGIKVESGVILCAGAKVMCSKGTLVVAENSIVAANAVLLESTAPNEIWGGIPATKISNRVFEQNMDDNSVNSI